MDADEAIQTEGLLLMGGQASRFGSDKMRHEWNGQPLAHAAFYALASVCDFVSVSTGSDMASSVDFPQIETTPWRVLPDEHGDRGPLEGIRSVLSVRQADVLVLAGDLPCVSAASLDVLIRRASASSAIVVLAAGRESGQKQPLCAVWKQAILEPLGQYLEQGARSVMGLIESVEYDVVSIPDDELININRPEDLDLLE